MPTKAELFEVEETNEPRFYDFMCYTTLRFKEFPQWHRQDVLCRTTGGVFYVDDIDSRSKTVTLRSDRLNKAIEKGERFCRTARFLPD